MLNDSASRHVAGDPNPTQLAVDPYRGALVRGIVVNALGILVKSLAALWVPIATWLFGTNTMGAYWLAIPLEELCASIVSSGLSDAATIFASYHVEQAKSCEDAERRMYQVLGNSLSITVIISCVLGIVLHLGAAFVTRMAFPTHPELETAIGWLAWTIAPAAFISVAIAATKAKLLMQYDPIINGLVRPAFLTVATLVCWLISPTLQGLMIAIWLSTLLTAVVCILMLARHFDGKKLLKAALRPKFDRKLIGFALPQSLNLTLNRYIARFDILVLGWYGASSASLALYGSASWLTSQLRTIRTTFSGALAPIAARHHASGERTHLAQSLADMSRWCSTLVTPIVLLAVVLRNDVLSLISREFPSDTRFVVLLLVPAFVGTAFGIAGNALIFTGHSRMNLLNSALVAVLNTGFAFLLIPRFGAIGAALAVAVATIIQTAAQAIELKILEQVEIDPKRVYKPFAAMVLPTVLLIVFWDPANLATLSRRVLLGAIILVLYVGLLYALKLEELVVLKRYWEAFRAKRAAKLTG